MSDEEASIIESPKEPEASALFNAEPRPLLADHDHLDYAVSKTKDAITAHIKISVLYTITQLIASVIVGYNISDWRIAFAYLAIALFAPLILVFLWHFIASPVMLLRKRDEEIGKRQDRERQLKDTVSSLQVSLREAYTAQPEPLNLDIELPLYEKNVPVESGNRTVVPLLIRSAKYMDADPEAPLLKFHAPKSNNEILHLKAYITVRKRDAEEVVFRHLGVWYKSENPEQEFTPGSDADLVPSLGRYGAIYYCEADYLQEKMWLVRLCLEQEIDIDVEMTGKSATGKVFHKLFPNALAVNSHSTDWWLRHPQGY